jgi:hypothetical protein
MPCAHSGHGRGGRARYVPDELDAIGARPPRGLSARDVRSGLSQLAARYSTRSLQITRLSLERAIRHAEADDLAGRNVAPLVKAPQGRDGRPSKSFTLEEAKVLACGDSLIGSCSMGASPDLRYSLVISAGPRPARREMTQNPASAAAPRAAMSSVLQIAPCGSSSA